MKKIHCFFYLPVLLFMGCSHHLPQPSSKESIRGEWRGTSAEYENVRLSFLPDGRLIGYDGCNHFGTKYQVSDKNHLQLATPIASTMMMCAYQKNDLSRFIQKVDRFERDDTRLILIDSTDGKKITFHHQKASFPAGVYQVRSYLSDKKMITPSPVLTFDVSADGKLSGFTGCNRYFANYTDNADRLYISYPAYSRVNCEPSVMDQESVFLELFGRVDRYKVFEKTIRLYDAGGMTLIEITKQ